MTSLLPVFPDGLPLGGAEPVRATVPGLAALLTWGDLERILATSCFEGAGSEAIRDALNLPGPGLSRVCVLTNGESIWRAPRGTALADLRRRLPGATLRVEALEEVHPPLAALAAELSSVGGAVYINAYAAWSDRKGLALHYDYTDNLVLQIEGRKHWRIYRPTRPAVRGPESSAYKEGLQAAARGEDPGDHEGLREVRAGLFWEGDLTAGDVLYVPPGWFHEVVPVGEPTLHLACAYASAGPGFRDAGTIRLPEELRPASAS
ncbi:JmjC domain-containing protein [Kitasatospora sp. NPDC087314]|uniref:JmjC domain-containing protein n=1 Tax=Kitasatospora sp. NPDC087314 TaxID=3364068 RepID=UPI0038258282